MFFDCFLCFCLLVCLLCFFICLFVCFLWLTAVHSAFPFSVEWNSSSRKEHLFSCHEPESKSGYAWGCWVRLCVFFPFTWELGSSRWKHMKILVWFLKLCNPEVEGVASYLHLNILIDWNIFFCNIMSSIWKWISTSFDYSLCEK